jgi:hypothetical protein
MYIKKYIFNDFRTYYNDVNSKNEIGEMRVYNVI